MRPEVVAWLGRFGVPAWVVPNYFMVAGMAGLLGSALVLRLARRDGSPVRVQAEALALGYVAALLGGSLFEMVRALPAAWQAGSWAPVLFAGRAAYGGLLAALLASGLYLRWRGEPVVAFFDRVSVGAGAVFVVGRLGCFLAGCDYGLPTASPLGVRFPSGSLAAVDHAQRGWVPVGAPSLPVHPTQLYECALGAVSALVAARVLRRGARPGHAFLTWVCLYATGRLLNECLRGDLSRGLYGGLSTSQYVSLALLLGCAAVLVRRARGPRPAVLLTPLLALLAVAAPGRTLAQDTQEARDTPAPQTSPPPPPQGPAAPPGGAPPGGAPPAEAPRSPPPVPRQGLGVRFSFFPSVPVRSRVPAGLGLELDLTYAMRLSPSARLEVGLGGRAVRNALAMHYGLGPVFTAVVEASPVLELLGGLALPYTLLQFDSPFFPPRAVLAPRVEFGLQVVSGGGLLLGGTVLGWSSINSRATGLLVSWEPRIWVGRAF